MYQIKAEANTWFCRARSIKWGKAPVNLTKTKKQKNCSIADKTSFSSYLKSVRTPLWIKRFIKNLKAKRANTINIFKKLFLYVLTFSKTNKYKKIKLLAQQLSISIKNNICNYFRRLGNALQSIDNSWVSIKWGNSFILLFNSSPCWGSTAVNPNECTACKKKHQLKLLCFHFCHTQVFAGLKTVRRMKIYPNLINLISYFQRHFFPSLPFFFMHDL